MLLLTDDDYIDSVSQDFKFNHLLSTIISPCSREPLLDVLTELLLLPGGEDPVDHHHDQPDEDEGQTHA